LYKNIEGERSEIEKAKRVVKIDEEVGSDAV